MPYLLYRTVALYTVKVALKLRDTGSKIPCRWLSPSGICNDNSKVWYIHPDFVAETYTLDINLTVDGTAYDAGHSSTTFDVYVGGSRVADDVKDYCAGVTAGASYTVKDIKVSGCYKNNGSASYSGTVNAATSVTIPIVTNHTKVTIAAKAATCTQTGLTAGAKCSVCGKILTAQTTTAALNHSWNSGVVTKAATCTAAGVKTYTCTRSGCGAAKTETIAAMGHNYKTETVDATSTEPAKIVHTCTRCGDTYETTQVIYGEWTATKPESGEYETKTQYRKSTKQTTTSTSSTLSGWTNSGAASWKLTSSGTHYYFTRPSGFSSSEYSSYVNVNEKVYHLLAKKLTTMLTKKLTTCY